MIDIKTLHIGSHVSVDGRRCEVCSIDDEGVVRLGDSERNYSYHQLHEVEPIPISAALLEELGFERDMRRGVTAYQMKRGEMWIGVAAMHDGLWRIEAMDDTYNYGNCTVRYLHEAEAFLALHGVELINENKK